MREAERRLEPIRRELDQQPERVLEVDRVHEPAVLDAAVLDPALVKPLDRLVERRLRDVERDVMHAPRVRRRAGRVRLALLVREDGDEPSVTGIEVEMTLGRTVEIRLIEHERHPEDSFPEVDRGPPVGPDERDVMDPLGLQLAQVAPSFELLTCQVSSVGVGVARGDGRRRANVSAEASSPAGWGWSRSDAGRRNRHFARKRAHHGQNARERARNGQNARERLAISRAFLRFG